MEEARYNSDLGVRVDYASDVIAELKRRRSVELLMDVFPIADLAQKAGILEVLSAIGGKQVDSTMRKIANGHDGEAAFFALTYFAQTGDTSALHGLNCRWNWWRLPVSSTAWVATVELFEKYRYYPAAPNLVEILDAAVLNLGDASQQALVAMFPEAHPERELLPADAKAFWQRFLSRHLDDHRMRPLCGG